MPTAEIGKKKLDKMLASGDPEAGGVIHSAIEDFARELAIGRANGSIGRGGQNLPGNWESRSFSLPQRITEGVPRIGDHDTTVLMHNDAVVQGLSEVPFMADVKRWGVLTIGTGLGNAVFANKAME